MVLSNYWKAFKLATIFNGNSGYSRIDLGLVNIQGNRQTVVYGINSGKQSYVQSNAKIRDVDGIRIGIGSGQIQPSDYCLFNDVTDSISNLEFSVVHSTLDNKLSSIINISGLNNSESEIVISELGITKTFIINDSGSTTAPVMLAKLALNRPVTVPPSGAFAFTIEWDEA